MSDESDKLKQHFQENPTQVKHDGLRDDLHKAGINFGGENNESVVGIREDYSLEQVIAAVEMLQYNRDIGGPQRNEQKDALLSALYAAKEAIAPEITTYPETHAEPEITAVEAEPVAQEAVAEGPKEEEILHGPRLDEVISDTVSPEETVTEEKQAGSTDPKNRGSRKEAVTGFVDKLRGKADELLHGDRKKLALVSVGALVVVGLVAKLTGGKDQTIAGQKLPTPNNQNQNQDRGVA